MNRITLFLLTLISFSNAIARDRSDSEMQRIAQNVLQRYLPQTRSGVEAKISCLATTDQLAIYGVEGQNFAVIAKSDRAVAILGYSDTAYEPGQMPCCMEAWMENCDRALAANPTSVVPLPMLAPQVSDPGEYLIQSKWDQGTPYNEFTPTFSRVHSPTGCVATAMAMVMKYYEWPAQGRNSGTYTVEGNKQTKQRETKNVYDWSAMKDTYGAYSTAPEVATLMFDCGASIKMVYGKTSSSAYSGDIPRGMTHNFQYDSLSMRIYYTDYIDSIEYERLIIDEINQKRPVLMSATSKTGGHQFIVDGVDENGYLHVNWGWSGTGNGFFALAGDFGGYNSGQDIIVGITPNNRPIDQTDHSFCVSDKNIAFKNDDGTLSLVMYNFYNLNWRTFRGTIGIVVEDDMNKTARYFDLCPDLFGENQTSLNLQPLSGYNLVEQETGEPSSLPISEFFPEILTKAGSYNLYIASQTKREAEVGTWSVFGQPGGFHAPLLTVAADGSFSLTEVVTGIEQIKSDRSNFSGGEKTGLRTNLLGQPVGKAYRGIVIEGGKITLRR